MATCINPDITTTCESACTAEPPSDGFYKNADGDVFDFNFSGLGSGAGNTGARNAITGTNGHTYFKSGGSCDTRDCGDPASIVSGEEASHVDLCLTKKAEVLQEQAEISGASAWMSAGELVVWLIVAAVMYGVYGMFEAKMKFKESFLCQDLSSGIFKMANMGKIYVLLCFAIMFVIRKLTQTKTLQKVDLTTIKAYLEDFLPYSVISLGAYVFFSGYLRIKASDQGMSGGGVMDVFKNMSTTALTVYIGILLMVINAFGLSYFYLRQKAQFRNDEYARALYWGQITTLAIGGLTAIFVALFATACGSPISTKLFIIIKWVLLITLTGLLIHKINLLTREPHYHLQNNEDLKSGEDWFSTATTAEKAFVADTNSFEGAHLRDNNYTLLTADTAEEDEWKARAYKNVYGKCHRRNDAQKCTGEQDKGNCHWSDALSVCSIGKCVSTDEGTTSCAAHKNNDDCTGTDNCGWVSTR